MAQVLFQIWILSFLFYRVDLIGTLSIDNIMVPVLAFAWLLVGDRSNVSVNVAQFRMILIVTLIFSLLIIFDIAKMGGADEFAIIIPPVVEHLKHYGYILVPLLYISSEKHLKWALVSLLVVIVINSALAILGSFGMAHTFVLVGESSRIPGLLRARGPLVNDGDTALLISFLGLLAWTGSRQRIRITGTGFAVKIVVMLILFGGVIATQSRNVILTVAMVFIVYYWLRSVMQSGGGGGRILVSMIGILVFFVTVVIIILNADAIIAWVTNMFGVSGEGTVRDRISSYHNAIKLLDGSSLLGLSALEVSKNSLFIAKLHNMWLGMAMFSGVFGVALILSLIIIGFVGALRLARDNYWKEYGLVFVSFILTALVFSPNFYPGHNAFIFWFCVGIALTSQQTYYFIRRGAAEYKVDMTDHEERTAHIARHKVSILRYKLPGNE